MLKRACEDVRPQLSAFHDEELPVEERIAIAGHLQECVACAVEAEDFRVIRDGLRGAGAAIQAGWSAESERLPSEVADQVRAERDEAFLRRAGRLLEDPRRVWATASAVVASTAFALLIVGMLAGAARDHATSLAEVVQRFVAAAQQVRVQGPVVMPRANTDAVMPAAAVSWREDVDAVSAFMAIVTRDGNLINVQLLEAEGAAGASEAQDRQLKADLLAAAAIARFEPARIAGTPVAVNVVWLLAHTTVHGRRLEGKPTDAGWPRGDPGRNDRLPRARTQRLS